MDENNLENEIKSLTHEDLCEITLSTLRRLVTSDKLLLDLPPDVTTEEVNAQIAVAQGQSITVTILRSNESPLQVVISPQKSTVYDLKKAIQRCFELKQQRSRSRSKISWKYVWQTYNLRNNDEYTGTDDDYCGPVMCEDHRLVARHGVRNKSKIAFVKRLRNCDNRYRSARVRDRSVERYARRGRSIDRRDRSVERRDRSIDRYDRRDRSIERRDRSIERRGRSIERRDRSTEKRDRSIERRDRSIDRYDRRDRSIERRDRSIERRDRSIDRRDRSIEKRDRSIERYDRRGRSAEKRDRSVERHDRSIDRYERFDRSFEQRDRSFETRARSIENPPEVVKLPEKSYSKADPRLKNLLNNQ